MVGARGFEPPTPWFRTRFNGVLKSIEIEWSQLIEIECVVAALLDDADLFDSWRL